MFKKNFLLGVGFSEASEDEVLEYIITGLQQSTEKYYVVTPNPEILVIANKDDDYKKVLNNAKLALVDGVGIKVAGQIMGMRLGDRITGVDLVKSLCRGCAEKPITIGFLGAGPHVAEQAAECLREKYPSLKIVFAESGNPDDETVLMIQDKLAKKEIKHINLLFVAFGSPKQELWIAKNLDKLPIDVAIGVGGAFDFISGKTKRAPKWVRNIGFEWLFRLIIQPWRIKRQLSLITFTWLVFKEIFSLGTSSKS